MLTRLFHPAVLAGALILTAVFCSPARARVQFFNPDLASVVVEGVVEDVEVLPKVDPKDPSRDEVCFTIKIDSVVRGTVKGDRLNIVVSCFTAPDAYTFKDAKDAVNQKGKDVELHLEPVPKGDTEHPTLKLKHPLFRLCQGILSFRYRETKK